MSWDVPEVTDLDADVGMPAAPPRDDRLGLNGQCSEAWRLNREATILLAAGPRALLLLLAQPLVAEGVDQHSTFREDPWRWSTTCSWRSTRRSSRWARRRACGARVRSYWQRQTAGGETHRIRGVIDRVADVEYTPTDSVSEARLLEANLIKRYRPRFNETRHPRSGRAA